MLWSISEFTLIVVVLGMFFLVAEMGFQLGRRRWAEADERLKGHIGALQAALLGLLALLLGFTFAMAVTRFDTRKALVLEEANAIGTTVLRARLLPPPHQQEMGTLLRAYVDARLAFYDAGIDRVRLEAAHTTTTRLQEQLWLVAVALAAQDPYALPVGLFVQALNEVIDLHEKRRQALDNHVPETVLVLLVGVAVAALGFLGYSFGLDRTRRFWSSALVSVLIALVLALILDLDRPRRGLITVSQESMVRLQEAFKAPRP